MPSLNNRWLDQNGTGFKLAAAMGILIPLVVIVWALPMQEISGLIQSAAGFLGPWGFLVYAGAFLIMTLTSIPVWIMPFLAGALFGPVWGTIIASLSCTVSAAAGFLIARGLRATWLRDWLAASPRMRAFEQVVDEESWKIVAAVRVSHFLTFGMQNYAFGLTNIGIWTFLAATWVVTMPGILLQVYLGHLGFTSMEAWCEQATPGSVWILRIAGLIFIAVAVGYVGHFIRRAWGKSITEPLAQALEDEHRKSGQPSGVRALPIMVGLALLLGCLSVWCVVHRDTIRRAVIEARGALGHSLSLGVTADES